MGNAFIVFIGFMIYAVFICIVLWLAVRFVTAVEKMSAAIESIAEKMGE